MHGGQYEELVEEGVEDYKEAAWHYKELSNIAKQPGALISC